MTELMTGLLHYYGMRTTLKNHEKNQMAFNASIGMKTWWLQNVTLLALLVGKILPINLLVLIFFFKVIKHQHVTIINNILFLFMVRFSV
jgi:hypothetical protein